MRTLARKLLTTAVSVVATVAVTLSAGPSNAGVIATFDDPGHVVSRCDDDVPVTVEFFPGGWTVFGDQDGDGVLAGIDCQWT